MEGRSGTRLWHPLGSRRLNAGARCAFLCAAAHVEGMTLPRKPLPPVNRQPQGISSGGQFAPNAHAEPDIALPTEKAHRSIALPDIPLRSGGSGSLPPLPPSTGGSGASRDDAEREESIKLMSSAVRKNAARLINRGARTINISARENNGTLRFDDVLDGNGNSIDDEDGSLAGSLTSDVNANRVGGGIPAEQILGTAKSAAIDSVALFDGELKIVGPGKPPRY